MHHPGDQCEEPPCRTESACIAKVYSKISERKAAHLENRCDQVYLACLDTNHHWDLRHYLHCIDVEVSSLFLRYHSDDQPPGTMIARKKTNFKYG